MKPAIPHPRKTLKSKDVKSSDQVAWIGLDVHAKLLVMGWMDQDGNRQGHWSFPTSERQLLKHLQLIPAQTKNLALEE